MTEGYFQNKMIDLKETAAMPKKYVRSQTQIAEYSERARGRVLTEHEVLAIFGRDVLDGIENEGAYYLIRDPAEPFNTLRSRRLTLGLSVGEVARRSGLMPGDIESMELPGTISAIRNLERVAQTLGLDDGEIGWISGAGGDVRLGYRLRDLLSEKNGAYLTEQDVSAFAEASWQIKKYVFIEKLLSPGINFVNGLSISPSEEFELDGKAYLAGFSLAERTRTMLGMDPLAPIHRIDRLIEHKLQIPIMQYILSESVAGATVSGGDYRGIVINTYKRSNFMRRMTLAHELGHLLWDPDGRLNHLRVGSSSSPDRFSMFGSEILDVDTSERRANAFAVAFLAPPIAIRELASEISETSALVVAVMRKYGIGLQAAARHVSNVLQRKLEWPDQDSVPGDDSEWAMSEDLWAENAFYAPPTERRGHFSRLVVTALSRGLITLDSAMSYLAAGSDSIQNALRKLNVDDSKTHAPPK